MSISSMTNDFTATLKRQVATSSASGAKTLSYTTAKRTTDGLSISISASFQGLSSEEKAQYGVIDTNMSWSGSGLPSLRSVILNGRER